MTRRCWTWLLALTLWTPAAATWAVLQGCSSRGEITEQESIQQRPRERQDRKRTPRLQDLERKAYDV